jgi:WD40 repeat protein
LSDKKGIFVTGGEDNKIRLWDCSNIKDIKRIKVLKGHLNAILNVSSLEVVISNSKA